MLWPLLLTTIGYTLVFTAIVLARLGAAVNEHRLRALLLARSQGASA